jgi:hypothetical protein
MEENLDLEYIRSIRNQIKKEGAKSSNWLPKDGRNRIRFLKPLTEKRPCLVWYDHFIGGRYYSCPKLIGGGSCAICEVIEEMLASGRTELVEFARRISPSLKTAWIILDRDEKDLLPRFFIASKSVTDKLIGWLESGDYGDFTDLLKGRDFILEKKNVGGIFRYDLSPLDPEPVSKDKEKIKELVENIPDFSQLRITSYEETKEVVEDFLKTKSTESREEKKTEKMTVRTGADSVSIKSTPNIDLLSKKESISKDTQKIGNDQVSVKGDFELEAEIDAILKEAEERKHRG